MSFRSQEAVLIECEVMLLTRHDGLEFGLAT